MKTTVHIGDEVSWIDAFGIPQRGVVEAVYLDHVVVNTSVDGQPETLDLHRVKRSDPTLRRK
jgi:hypothetical protein